MEKIYSGIINYARGPESEIETAACLDESERQRLARLRPPMVKAAFLAGRALVRGMLSARIKTDQALIKFDLAPGGKPQLAGMPNIHCNISHSHHLAVAAWGKSTLGIDIEFQKPNRDIIGIAEGFYGPAEQNLICGGGIDAIRIFHICWSLKEAWLKLGGDGFAGFGTAPQFLPTEDGNLNVILSTESANGPLAEASGFFFQARELITPEGDRYFWALACIAHPEAPLPKIVDDKNFQVAWAHPPKLWESGFVINSVRVSG